MYTRNAQFIVYSLPGDRDRDREIGRKGRGRDGGREGGRERGEGEGSGAVLVVLGQRRWDVVKKGEIRHRGMSLVLVYGLESDTEDLQHTHTDIQREGGGGGGGGGGREGGREGGVVCSLHC